MNMSKKNAIKTYPRLPKPINYPRKVDWDLARDNMHFGKYGHEQLAKLFVGKVVPKKKPNVMYVNFQGSTKGNLYLSLFNFILQKRNFCKFFFITKNLPHL